MEIYLFFCVCVCVGGTLFTCVCVSVILISPHRKAAGADDASAGAGTSPFSTLVSQLGGHHELPLPPSPPLPPRDMMVCVTRPLISAMGSGPKSRLSRDHGRLSPVM